MQKIALVLFDGARLFDTAVVDEVWGARSGPDVELRRCAATKDPVELVGGAVFKPERTFSWLRTADVVVVPGLANLDAEPSPELLAALRAAHRAGAQVAGLCLGAFVLGAAGLLDDRPAVTHWRFTRELARRHPRAEVDPGVLFTGADGVWTSAGVAAGIDLCLHLVRLTLGADVAASIARSMVTAPFRSGGQAQFITAPSPARDEEPLAAVRERALRELRRPLTVAELAGWAAMSERTFARRFVAETGTTPLRWLLDQRIARAQQLLESSDLPVAEIAGCCGFGSAVSFRQHFTRHVGIAPSRYRTDFRPATASASR
ncbi:helix-turn-helix domain-containing protein [Amycolatopsis rhabdoformis]|uniref:Helix-turn-helix domain-containing protein n=1 Tax=Amycolatopsis rhabdoformis TaxID=1448059 RepID=A0ABZ1HWM6_9PSEU|nr:helix-turn-helix domain-containing protein [Amycolatopsis rhabdoformis]WSE26565.1 helix-turn-helix domain-containing protein [Amycolatopsis rhabdoformis]